jgi:octaprenyl-diphosphate synthase
MTASSLAQLADGRIDPKLLSEISREVFKVEEELARQMGSRVDVVHQVNEHTLKAGGKRLRPAFVALAARATGNPFLPERTLRLGACMEMIHMATLLHDDVIDESATRRGRPTACAAFGNTAAILSGDVLLAKAMLLLSQDGDLEVIRTVSEAVMDIAEGEVQEMELRGDFELSADRHLDVLRMKTASFIQCCCEVGAIIAGASDEIRSGLRRYAHHVGLAFQIADDLLDYRGDKSKTGKPIAIDFRDGQATLPLILLRSELSPAEAAIIRQRFGSVVSDDEIRMIVEWMYTRGAFDRAEAQAKQHVDAAKRALEELPSGAERDLLRTVADYVLERNS